MTRRPCHLRSAHSADEAFIFNSYINSYANYQLSHGQYTAINGDVFKRAIHQQLAEILPHRDVIVACAVDDPEIAIGYAIGIDLGDAIIVDYCYVKHPLRRFGVARYLLSDLGVTPGKTLLYTHETRKVQYLIKHQTGHVSYVPAGSIGNMLDIKIMERKINGKDIRY